MTDTSAAGAETRRIALVTGASRGIGRAIAVALAEAGCHVVAVARTQGGLEELDDEIRARGGSATLVPMSVTDVEAIDRLGLALYERYGRLDALVGNAAILGPLSPLQTIDPKKWDEVFTVNVTANFRLIRSMDPLLRRSPAGRAVFVSSGSPHSCKPYWGAYAASKAALEAMVRVWAAEVASFGIRANILDPGRLRTNMRAQAMPGENPLTLETPDVVAPHVVAMLDPANDRTGQIFSYPLKTWTEPRTPAPVSP